MPVDANGQPLAFHKKFANNPAAMAWLWKDHTGVAEAAEITALAGKIRPQYLAKCGGTYSSEWFFSKILHCLRAAPEVFNAAHSWIELADYVPAALTGTGRRTNLPSAFAPPATRPCTTPEWGGYPDAEFLAQTRSQTGRLARPALSKGRIGGPRRRRFDRGLGRENRPARGHSRGRRRV